MSDELASQLRNQNYDPYYSYREHISKLSSDRQVKCWNWWRLEGKCFLSNIKLSEHYTKMLCDELGLDSYYVLREIRLCRDEFRINK